MRTRAEAPRRTSVQRSRAELSGLHRCRALGDTGCNSRTTPGRLNEVIQRMRVLVAPRARVARKERAHGGGIVPALPCTCMPVGDT